MHGQQNIKQDSFSSSLQIPLLFQRDCVQNVQEKVKFLYWKVLKYTYRVKSYYVKLGITESRLHM
jgi:hypothetical protein